MGQEFDQFDCESVRILKGVEMLSHPDLPAGVGVIEISFPDCNVFICIEDAYDTLLCTRTMPASHNEYTCRVASSFWDSIIGKTLTNAWKMTNDRGYTDAIQLRFRDLPNAGEYTLVQLYGEASQITLTELKVVRGSSLDQQAPERVGPIAG